MKYDGHSSWGISPYLNAKLGARKIEAEAAH